MVKIKRSSKEMTFPFHVYGLKTMLLNALTSSNQQIQCNSYQTINILKYNNFNICIKA